MSRNKLLFVNILYYLCYDKSCLFITTHTCILFILLHVEKQKPLPLVYKEERLDAGYRLDLIVESKVIIEVKSIEVLNDIHTAQVLTYLKVSGCKVGLLMNFNVLRLVDGLKRLVNKF